jgi:hypothetical protein
MRKRGGEREEEKEKRTRGKGKRGEERKEDSERRRQRGITETVPSLFRGIFSERNSVPNPTHNVFHRKHGKSHGFSCEYFCLSGKDTSPFLTN